MCLHCQYYHLARKPITTFLIQLKLYVGNDSSVGIANGYRLDDPGIESWWRRDFPHTSRPGLWPTQTPVQCVPGLFPGGKAAGAWRWQLKPSSAQVKGRVELYPYSPSGPSWPVLGWPLPLLAGTAGTQELFWRKLFLSLTRWLTFWRRNYFFKF